MPASRTPHLHHEIRQGTGLEKNDRDLIVVDKTERKYEKLSRRDIKDRIGKALNPMDELVRVDKNNKILYLPTSLEFVGIVSKLREKNITPIITPRKSGMKGYFLN